MTTTVDKRLAKHWKTTRPSRSNPDHLTHAHLHNSEASEKSGKDVYWSPVLKITNVSIGLVKSQDKPNGEELIFLHFEGHSRKLGLNSTNSKTMTSLAGSPVPLRWVGLSIQLYVDPQAKYPKGEKGPAIRIRPTVPKAGAASERMPEPSAEDVARLEAARDARVGDDDGPVGASDDGNHNRNQGREPGQD